MLNANQWTASHQFARSPPLLSEECSRKLALQWMVLMVKLLLIQRVSQIRLQLIRLHLIRQQLTLRRMLQNQNKNKNKNPMIQFLHLTTPVSCAHTKVLLMIKKVVSIRVFSPEDSLQSRLLLTKAVSLTATGSKPTTSSSTSLTPLSCLRKQLACGITLTSATVLIKSFISISPISCPKPTKWMPLWVLWMPQVMTDSFIHSAMELLTKNVAQTLQPEVSPTILHCPVRW